MTSQIAKRVTDSQPAIILATALAACLSHRWPTVAAVFVVLQIGIVLAAWGTRRPRARHDSGIRFLSRAIAVPQRTSNPLPRSHRPHLHLVP